MSGQGGDDDEEALVVGVAMLTQVKPQAGHPPRASPCFEPYREGVHPLYLVVLLGLLLVFALGHFVISPSVSLAFFLCTDRVRPSTLANFLGDAPSRLSLRISSCLVGRPWKASARCQSKLLPPRSRCRTRCSSIRGRWATRNGHTVTSQCLFSYGFL